MADPHHVEILDGLDRLTVRLYRSGLSIAALGIAGVAGTVLYAPDRLGLARALVVIGVGLAALDIHLYDRRVRWLFGAMAWTAAFVTVVAPLVPIGGEIVADAGLGFAYATLSAIALKERLCFRIPGLVHVPWLLALSLVPLVAGMPLACAAITAVGCVAVTVLAVAKWTQPLHFDIGDKSAYQI